MVFLTEASSSSSSNSDKKYDVFLSFRGIDTRLSFTNHLHTALVNANLTTFLDDQEIDLGLCLKPELETAIRSSRASIIVLSKNYASSTWCLNELVSILEQHRNSDHIVIPVFYHVEPTDLRNQRSTFGDAMAKHMQRMQSEPNAEKRSQWDQKIELWKDALTEVAGLKGKDAKDRLETKFIEEIVRDIYDRLCVPLRTTLPLLIGTGNSIKFIASWLTDESLYTTDILTILGIGGIGKTSLARYIYGLYCHEFQVSSFLEDISRRCSQVNGLLDVQKQLFDEISKRSSIQLYNVSSYTLGIDNALVHKKVLLVLDDIDCLEQLDGLLGTKGFHPGSKIIITTKDASLTERSIVYKKTVKPKHTKHLLGGISTTASLELLCLHAFECNVPKEGYEEVSKKLVKYCEGHPLALEVLGKSLHNRDVAYWESCIEGLKKEPHSCVQRVLQMSFDSLPSPNDKDLFKHIACFFVGIDRDITETILKACQINTRSGIANLVERCLLSIGRNNVLMMHQLIQEMGKDTVRQESPNKPWKRSRLWCHEESFKVLKQKKGTENLLGLSLDMRMLEKQKLRGSFELKTDAFCNMDNLMLLQLNYVQLNGSFKNLPEELRWLCMRGFPLKFIPSDLQMDNIVVLDMQYSNIESFGMFYSNSQQLESRQKLIGSCSKDKRLLGSLKILDLSFCERLSSVGGFVELPELEMLILKKCIGLIELCESIEQCAELVFIDICYCRNLEKLPQSIGKLKKLKTLLIDDCNFSESRIEVMDMDSSQMLNDKTMPINSQTSSSAIVEAIPRDLMSLLISLPCSLVSLSLKGNNLSNESFPNDFSSLFMLKDLYLDGNPIVSMPNCVRSLPSLETLSMYDCKFLTSVEHPPRTLKVFSHNSYSNSSHGYNSLLRKIVFDPEMSELLLLVDLGFSAASSIEIEGIVKIEPMAGVAKKILRSLGWSDLEFIEKRRTGMYDSSREPKESQSQMYFEFGIFSTIYGGKGMPHWIRHRRIGTSLSFTIPSLSKKLRGLNFCYVHTLQFQKGAFQLPDNLFFVLPLIRISNITKNRTWIYKHCIQSVSVDGKCLIFLSHWILGINDMEGGDQFTITVTEDHRQLTRECGVGLVYDDGSMEEEEDVLDYYKSWNHIISGDLSAFQVTTGEYILYFRRFLLGVNTIASQIYHSLMTNNPPYKEVNVPFRAFSHRKSHILGQTPELQVRK